MTLDRDYLFGIAFWMAFGGLIVWGYSAATEKKLDKTTLGAQILAQRKQATQAAINAGPQTRSWQTSEGTVVELTIPKVSGIGGLLETQRCIVWRDSVTQTSALHCDKDEISLQDYPSDPPDIGS